MKAWFLACTLAAFPFPAFSSPVTVNASDSGWYSEFGFHNPSNTNYITGFTGSLVTRSLFVFDLSSISGVIVSATLRLPNFQSLSPDATETFAIFDVSTALATLTAGGSGLTGIFADLGTGTTYGSGPTPGGVTLGTTQDFGLNAAGLAALNVALGGQVALGGALTTLSGQVLANEYAFGFSQDSIPQLLLETTEAVPEPGNMLIVLFCGLAMVFASRARRGGKQLICVIAVQAILLPHSMFAIRLGNFGDVVEANNPGSGVYTRVCPSNNSLSEACHTNLSYFSLVTSNTPWDNLFTSSNASEGSMSGQAAAATGGGALRARADAAFAGYTGGNYSPGFTDPPTGYASAALAWVTEDITIRGPVGESGLLVTSFRLTGVLGSSWDPTDGNPFLLMHGAAGVYITQTGSSTRLGSGYGANSGSSIGVDYTEVGTPNLSQSFLFNVPLRVTISISASVDAIDTFATPSDPRSGQAVADFFSTLVVNPFLITDNNGQPIPDLTIESTSGVLALDTRNTSDVPEPATCATILAALLAGSAAFKRRQS